jgi:ribosomal-protein-alanine acetyltransferase
MEREVISKKVVRPMIRDDAPAIARILAQSPEAAQWSPLDMLPDVGASAVSSTDILIDASEHDNEITGLVVVRTASCEVEVLNLAVLPSWRRRGVARELLLAAFSTARSAGARRAFLEVRESNLGARAFYLRIGFTEVGRRRAYYRNPSEDAMILARVLDE